jgi:RsiW-degrading membrane proteinase PrsW (M82 family)
MEKDAGQMPDGVKRTIAVAGLLLAMPGLLIACAHLCTTLVTLVQGGGGIGGGIASFALAVVTVGGGGAMFWHGLRSLRGRSSKPMRLPPIWALVGLFGLFVTLGLVLSKSAVAAALFFPPAVLAAAALPPLWAVSWFAQREAEGLTWRRGLVALAGGATFGALIALVLEVLFPAIVLALVLDLADVVLGGVEGVLEALAGRDIASAVTHPGFLYLFVQIAVIAPLAEELAKPLVTLPLIGRLGRRDAFWVGAMAGAGFAALENAIYAGLGLYFWAGILVVRSLGGAIHPLGAGLVALGWHGILKGERDGWRKGLIGSAIAVGMHALWNGGSLLVITLAGAQFFGELPPEVDVLGLSAAGTTLAVLLILGLAALWLGRAVGKRLESPAAGEGMPAGVSFVLSDRAVAIWALACLVAIVPAGIAGLQILLR